MGTRLYVGNLSYNVTEPELRDAFAEEGRNVVEVKVVMDRDTGRPRGFAFVEMGSDQEAAAAISSLTGRDIQGRAINVSEARERAPAAAEVVAAVDGGGGGGRWRWRRGGRRWWWRRRRRWSRPGRRRRWRRRGRGRSRRGGW